MSTTDRELLELAAKAIGRRIAGWNTQRGAEVAVLDDHSYWQPLLENGITDCDGDALRLAVSARLQIITSGTNIVQAINYWSTAYGECEVGDDRVAATRRAIVLAAAEIGKQKESENA